MGGAHIGPVKAMGDGSGIDQIHKQIQMIMSNLTHTTHTDKKLHTNTDFTSEQVSIVSTLPTTSPECYRSMQQRVTNQL